MAEHGKPGTYNRGCKCPLCTEANRAHAEKLRAALAMRTAFGDPRVPHGTAGGYKNWGCKCLACTAANTRASTDYYRRKRGAAGLDPG